MTLMPAKSATGRACNECWVVDSVLVQHICCPGKAQWHGIGGKGTKWDSEANRQAVVHCKVLLMWCPIMP